MVIVGHGHTTGVHKGYLSNFPAVTKILYSGLRVPCQFEHYQKSHATAVDDVI